MVYPIGKLFIKFINKFLIRKIVGLENIPEGMPFIIASNHTSFIDPYMLATIVNKVKKRIYFISAMFFFFDILSSFIFSELGSSIRLTKKVRGSYLNSALKQLKKGEIIGIFPEGLPNKKPHLRMGKTGIARLVLIGKVAVVPVSIDGTLYVWSRLKWFPRLKKRVVLSIGKPMYFKQYYGKQNNKKSLEKVTDKIMVQIGKLGNKKYPKRKKS